MEQRARALASDVVKLKKGSGLWAVLMKRGRLTEDEELLGWERGCLGLAELLELASSYRGSHVEQW